MSRLVGTVVVRSAWTAWELGFPGGAYEWTRSCVPNLTVVRRGLCVEDVVSSETRSVESPRGEGIGASYNACRVSPSKEWSVCWMEVNGSPSRFPTMPPPTPIPRDGRAEAVERLDWLNRRALRARIKLPMVPNEPRRAFIPGSSRSAGSFSSPSVSMSIVAGLSVWARAAWRSSVDRRSRDVSLAGSILDI